MDINKNVQYSIVRKMLILTVLGVFLISQNIAGIIYENKPSITDQGEIRWELLIINMSELILIILYYSQLDTETSEHFKGKTWDTFVSGYVIKSFRAKMKLLICLVFALPIMMICYSYFEEVRHLFFLSTIAIFSSLYAFISFDSLMLYKSAKRATDY
jgi:hypothetical protein